MTRRIHWWEGPMIRPKIIRSSHCGLAAHWRFEWLDDFADPRVWSGTRAERSIAKHAIETLATDPVLGFYDGELEIFMAEGLCQFRVDVAGAIQEEARQAREERKHGDRETERRLRAFLSLVANAIDSAELTLTGPDRRPGKRVTLSDEDKELADKVLRAAAGLSDWVDHARDHGLEVTWVSPPGGALPNDRDFTIERIERRPLEDPPEWPGDEAG